MANRISDETLLLSKYLANNSNKTADIEKAGKTVSTTTNKAGSSTSSKYDSLDLSSLDSDPLIYNNYNSQGQYETIPSLIDYLGSDSSNGLNSTSDNDALKLLGATGGSQLSLVDYLASNDAGKSGNDAYASVFNNLAEESAAKTDALIQQAMERIKEKESSGKNNSN